MDDIFDKDAFKQGLEAAIADAQNRQGVAKQAFEATQVALNQTAQTKREADAAYFEADQQNRNAFAEVMRFEGAILTFQQMIEQL
jgi:hypothetical protein